MSKDAVIDDPKAIRLAKYFANQLAEPYAKEVMFPAICGPMKVFPPIYENVKEGLKDSKNCFRVILGYYATARRGGDKDVLAKDFLSAIDRTLGKSKFEDFLDSGDSDALWQSYLEICNSFGRKPSEEQNRPVLEGIAKLNFEIYEETGNANLIEWIVNEILETHLIEDLFVKLTSIPTVGPKTASHILRDVSFLYDLEAGIEYSDVHLLSPINPVLRSVARYLIPKSMESKLPDAVLAGKVSRQLRLLEISNIRFNMGVAYKLVRPMPGQQSVDKFVDSLYNTLRENEV